MIAGLIRRGPTDLRLAIRDLVPELRTSDCDLDLPRVTPHAN